MLCEDVRPLVDKLSDNECSPSEKVRAEEHLSECETCREHYRFLNALPEAARRSPLPEPAEAYWDVLPRKVMARIEREETAKVSKGNPWFSPAVLRWAGAMAAGVVAVVLSFEVIDRYQPTAPPSKPLAEETPDQPDQENDSALGASFPAELGETQETARSQKPDPKTLSAAADEPPPEPASRPEPMLEEEVAKAAPQKAPEPPSPPPVAQMAVEQSEPERPRRSASTVAPSPAPGGARRDKEEVNPQAVREIDEVRAQRVASLQSAADEPATESRGAEAENESLVAFTSLERQYLRSDKRSLRTTSTGAGTSSEPELLNKCRNWRDYLEKYPESVESLEAQYRLSRCSIDLYHLRPSEERRFQALEDAKAFMEVAPEDERAVEIERLISGLREPKNN